MRTRKSPEKDAARTEEIGPAPTTPEELHAWLTRHLGLTVPRDSLIDGHAAPFDYLTWSFLESLRPGSVRDAVVWANRGGGKTFLAAVATLLDMLFRPGIEIRILGGSLEQSKRMYAHLRRMLDPAQRPALGAMVRGKMSERRLVFRNGSVVELLAQSQTSVRGTRVQKLRCDEVDLFDPEVWSAAQLTTRSTTLPLGPGCVLEVPGSVECLSTMHRPHGVMHGVVSEAREGRRALFRWGVVDVLERCGGAHACGEEGARCALWAECRGRAKRADQCGHVTVADAMSLKRRVSAATWEAEMLCRRPRRSNAVIPEFDAGVHVFEGPPPAAGVLWAAGMDPGIRTAAIVWGVLDAPGVLRIMDERVVGDAIVADHLAAMRAGLAREGVAGWPAPAWVAIDAAAGSRNEHTGVTTITLLQRAGFSVRAPRTEVQPGLELIRARLRPASGPPRLFVHARCVRLIESLERFRYSKDSPHSEVPRKGEGFDHAVDALRYLVQSIDRPCRSTHGRYAT